MDASIFMDKSVTPGTEALATGIGPTLTHWHVLEQYVLDAAKGITAQWHFSGAKYGWSYRLNDKKRVIVYLLPRQGYFKVAMVFGAKAYERVMQSEVSAAVKNELAASKPNAEGRGIRIDVTDGANLGDIKQLADIKLAN